VYTSQKRCIPPGRVPAVTETLVNDLSLSVCVDPVRVVGLVGVPESLLVAVDLHLFTLAACAACVESKSSQKLCFLPRLVGGEGVSRLFNDVEGPETHCVEVVCVLFSGGLIDSTK
jgi:hypothetical protein